MEKLTFLCPKLWCFRIVGDCLVFLPCKQIQSTLKCNKMKSAPSHSLAHATQIGLCRFVATEKNEQCQVACWTAYYTQDTNTTHTDAQRRMDLPHCICEVCSHFSNDECCCKHRLSATANFSRHLCHLSFVTTAWTPSAVYSVHFKCDIKHMFPSSSLLMISNSSSQSHTLAHTRGHSTTTWASVFVRAC